MSEVHKCCRKDTLPAPLVRSGDLAHVKDRRKRRRVWAGVAAWIILAGGPILILLGLTSDTMASRLVLLMPVLATFITPIAAIVCTYMGVGAYEIGKTITATEGKVPESQEIKNPEGNG